MDGISNPDDRLHAALVDPVEQRLRNVLRLNALTSSAAGLAGLAVAAPVARLLGVGAGWSVRLVGAGLVVFAFGALTAAGSRRSWLRAGARLVSLSDASGVLGVTALTLIGTFSGEGAAVMMATVAMVGGFATAQAASVRRMTPGPDVVPPTERVEKSRRVTQPAEILWPILCDPGLYGRLAPNLSAVSEFSAPRVGATRTCTNRGGRTWSETCIGWAEGRRFAVSVDTSDYPYPLARMDGEWWLEPSYAGDHHVAMAFTFQPRPGPVGRIFVVAMHVVMGLIARRILRGWARAAGASRTATVQGTQ